MDDSLPVGSPQTQVSTASAIPPKRRQYRACIACKAKKMKCDLGDPDFPSRGPCARCRRELRPCVFPADTGKPFSRKSTPALPRVASPTSAASAPSSSQHITLPDPASSSQHHRMDQDDEEEGSTDGNVLFSSALHNPGDALRMLATASALNPPASAAPPNLSNTVYTPVPNFTSGYRDPAPAGGGWSNWPPIVLGILTQPEAEFLFELFKLQLAPLYQLLAPELFEPAHLALLTSSEYLLLATMVTIAARFSVSIPPSNANRHRAIHLQMSEFIRQHISFILDGSPVTRHISSVESLLLLCEWPSVPTIHPFLVGATPAHDPNDIQAILRYSKTYDSLSWSYLGSAVRLAQELGLDNASLYSAEGVASLNAPGPKGWMQERALRTWIYCYNADRHVSVRLGRSAVIQTHMSSGWWETVCKIASMKFYASGLEHEWSEPMPQGFIASLLGTIHDRLYSNKELTRANLKTGDWERFLRSLTHEIQHMHRASESITRQGGVTSALLQIELHYVLLYANTISLRALQIRSQRRLKALDIFSIAPTLLNLQEGPYILAAIVAAQKILQSTVTMFDQGYLQLAPARLFQRVLFAATFLFKALAVGVVEDSQSSTHRLLDQAIDALERASSQDRETLCSGFAALLRRLQLQVTPAADTSFLRKSSSSTPALNSYTPSTSASHLPDLPSSTMGPPQPPAPASFTFPLSGTATPMTAEEEYNPLQPQPAFHWGPTSELLALGKEQDLLFQGLWSNEVQSQSFTLVDTLFGDEEWGVTG